MLKKWEDLPDFMQNDEVRPYYDSLKRKKISLILKRAMDLAGGAMLLVVLAIPMFIIAILIKIDSKGPVFYRQERVTTYGKHFKIHKFRTMVNNADKIGSAVTVGNDSRITKVGAKLRGCRLDGYDIIGQTRKSLENRGFREVSPMNFLDNHTRFGWYSCDMRIATV